MKQYILMTNIIIDVIVIPVLAGYLTYIWRNSRKTVLLQYYIVTHLFAIAFLAANMLTRIAPGESAKWVCIIFAYTLKACFDISFFSYGYYFLNRMHVNRKFIWIIAAYLVFQITTMVINPFHQLFITRMSILEYDTGILFYVYSFTGTAFEFIGAFFILKSLTMDNKTSKYKSFIMTAALSIFVLQFLNMNRIIYGPFDAMPLWILFIFTLLFIGACRLDPIHTLSLGIVRSFEMFTEAVLVFDEKGKLLYKNAACEIYDEHITSYLILKCRQILNESSRQAEHVLKNNIYLSEYDKTLTISIKPILSLLRKITGYVCIVHDDTAIAAAINELKEKNEQLEQMNESIKTLAEDNKRLAILEERNILAKDIHDILGHSLNYTLRILESNVTFIDEQPEKAVERLKQAVLDIDNGLDEIGMTSSGQKRNSLDTFVLLRKTLEQMAKRIGNIGVDLQIPVIDDLSGCDKKVFQIIYRICQEAVTNSIKHGRASQVVIAIKRRDNRLVLHIVDNGAGCASFKKGNGLSGMEERLMKVGGDISFGAFEDGEGFLVHATIPLG